MVMDYIWRTTGQIGCLLFPQPIWFLIFDHTFIYCALRKAPGSDIYRQHGNKTNRPRNMPEAGTGEPGLYPLPKRERMQRFHCCPGR